MTATVKQARDDIHQLFNDAWTANPTSANVPIYYWDTKRDIPSGQDANGNPDPWVRITVQHTTGVQGSLSGDSGARRWTRDGLVTIQIFTPYGTGLSLADDLAMIALATFEGAATPGSNIWFRNVRSEEIGQDGSWFQTNVIAEFTYDEVR